MGLQVTWEDAKKQHNNEDRYDNPGHPDECIFPRPSFLPQSCKGKCGQRIEKKYPAHPHHILRMLVKSCPIGNTATKKIKTDRKKNGCKKYRKRECTVKTSAVLFLRETEIGRFHAVGKKDIQKRNDSVYLGQVGGSSRLLKNKG